MKRGAYLLILLLISAPIDDAWALAVVPSAEVTEENNEYLSRVEVQPSSARLCAREPSTLAKLHGRSRCVAPGGGQGASPGTGEIGPFTPCLLYVFMSLQR